MSFEATKINGVTKQRNGSNYLYFFPICTFEAFYDADPAEAYFFQEIRGEKIKVRFPDIVNTLGASDIIDYLDKAAEAGLYFAFISTDGESEESTRIALSDQNSLFFIAQQLQQMTFLLKSISE